MQDTRVKVQYVSHRPIHEHDTRPDPVTASLPELIAVLLDGLKVDLV